MGYSFFLSLNLFSFIIRGSISSLHPSMIDTVPKTVALSEAKPLQKSIPKPLKPAYKVGDRIENFKALNYTSKYVELSDFKHNRGVILIFMRVTCEYCEAYESRVMALDKKYASLGYRVWAISPFGDNAKLHPLDDIPHMKIKALKMKYSFPYCADHNFEITNAFGDHYTPNAYVLENRKGNFFLRYIGDIDSDWQNKNPKKIKYVENAVDSLLGKHFTNHSKKYSK